MQAIQTKYISATSTKGSRVKAWCEAGSITVPYEYAHSESDMHYAAAQKLLVKLGWTGPDYGVLVQGCLPGNAGYCHVLTR